MKYLKKYKVFESRFSDLDVKDVFEPYINWNLIEDVKDMSLEYIDEGFDLSILFLYKGYYFLSISYNHLNLDLNWDEAEFDHLTEGPYELEPIDKNKIEIQIQLKNNLKNRKIRNSELISRIKESYPDENIKFDYHSYYYESVNESKIKTLNSLSDEELKEKLEWLRVEQHEIQEEISSVVKIITKRKESKESKYSETLPDSIFDFNKEQLDWVFEHHHGTTSKRYSIAGEYLSQLDGVMSSGFNQETNQFFFTIASSSCMDDNESRFELKPNIVKSIKFLGDNLKRVDGYVKFKVMYYHMDHTTNDIVRYYSEDNVEYGNGSNRLRHTFRKFNSIEELLREIVKNDLDGEKW